MFRLIVSAVFLLGTLGLNAQEPVGGHPFSGSEPPADVIRRIGPVIRIGAYLREQSLRDWADAASMWARPAAHSPVGARDLFTLDDPLRPMHSFTAEPRLPAEYDVRNNFSPLESYTIRLQPWNGFIIQNSLDPMQSYQVSVRPFDGYSIQNRMNPAEISTYRPQPFESLGSQNFPAWAPSSDLFGSGVGLSNPQPNYLPPFPGPSFPADFRQPREPF